MSRPRRAVPTRSNVLAVRKRLERVERGADLLRRKRRALVGELFRIARPALDARREIAEEARVAYQDLLVALAARGHDELDALGAPPRTVPVDLTTRVVWGIEVPDLAEPPVVVRSVAMRGQASATPGPAATQAATAFEHLVERLVGAATREFVLERLGEHLARTTRQVNVLEQRLAPALSADLARMRRVLEEREREDHLRLRHLLRTGRSRHTRR